ncbi:hypothetical protein Lesp02_22790 [Lentzea sp. NBRC 105346]|uniref:DUF1360 domain-containing protein n=1 Tax=Lentzea sp. NBRC 105346 TaxID=3032205 RepID=UPI0024A087BA|nr:DUF1360 domain-containing protein [Lentzea sp. NBRC 105346]GLZ30089.1 hypothetical protein Lesp02_22790 [Lentzea sp. NBRC 105346]
MTTPTRRMARKYAGHADRPVRGYAVVLGTYTLTVSALGLLGRAFGVRLPDRLTWPDTLLLGTATHKASRLLTKDAVTSPLRAPFAEFDEETGMGEVNESVRGRGVRHAAGELLTCPFCLAVWVSTGFTAGMVFAPRLTRLVATMLTAIGVSDALQIGYDAARESIKKQS